MQSQNISEESPGKLLRNFLNSIFPFDENEKSIFRKIDNALQGDKKIHRTIYESTINYILRRMVTLSRFLYRKNQDDETLFIKKLRIAIENNFDLPVDDAQFEELITLLIDCTRIAGRRFKPGETTTRYNKGGEDQRCYICGKTVAHPNENNFTDGATLDHYFPNALGGNNSPQNLKIACAKCNGQKQDMIDSSDSHYESISLVSDADDESFQTEMNQKIKIALWAKNDYRCSYCDKKATYVGELQLKRINDRDNWNYFNVLAYCEAHSR